MRSVVIFGTVALWMSVAPGWAAVLCQKPSGAVFVRSACKKKETRLDPGALGLQGPKGDPGTPGPPGPATGAAGGDLSGNYPNPQIAPGAVLTGKLADGAVTGAKVAAGTLRLSNLAVWTVGPGNIGGVTVPANGCVYFNFGDASGALNTDVVLPQTVNGPVPQGTTLSGVLEDNGSGGFLVIGGVCDLTSNPVMLSNPFEMIFYAVR